ncbi:hypothetical protein Bca52824_020993 [Brassica carinata]|uniref:Uncharacterized protein n=1 Tax=Brassica carinata TaxID=52824 RepID=A0A8X7VUJ4_BRACI|nr:hypothetical protein Bca52824_020993 [Brassica carinata]
MNQIISCVDNACTMRQAPRALTKSLEKMSVYLCENTSHSAYAKAIITGFFQSVGRNVTEETSLLSVKNEIHGVFDAYGPVLLPYANTLNLQLRDFSFGEYEYFLN